MSCVQLADPWYSDAWPDITLGDAERERETETQVSACTDLHAAWGGNQLPSVTLCLILCNRVMVITYCPSNPPVSSPPIGLELQLRVWPCLVFYAGARDLNSGPRPCVASVLTHGAISPTLTDGFFIWTAALILTSPLACGGRTLQKRI